MTREACYSILNVILQLLVFNRFVVGIVLSCCSARSPRYVRLSSDWVLVDWVQVLLFAERNLRITAFSISTKNKIEEATRVI